MLPGLYLIEQTSWFFLLFAVSSQEISFNPYVLSPRDQGTYRMLTSSGHSDHKLTTDQVHITEWSL